MEQGLGPRVSGLGVKARVRAVVFQSQGLRCIGVGLISMTAQAFVVEGWVLRAGIAAALQGELVGRECRFYAGFRTSSLKFTSPRVVQ